MSPSSFYILMNFSGHPVLARVICVVERFTVSSSVFKSMKPM